MDISQYIIPLLKPPHVEFLKSFDYYDNYTMTKEGISFRTEVALATLQESDPQNSRKLLALINGYTDGDVFKEHSNALLLVILNKIIHEAEKHQHLQYDDDKRKKAIGTLYHDMKSIASNVLTYIQDETSL